MSQVQVEYLQSDGRFRHRRAKIETKWPNFSLNHHDKQAHDLIDQPIFPVEKKPGVCRSWDELLNCDPPPVLRSVDRVMMVCEDNSIWPMSMNSDPDLDDRQMSRKDHFEEGFQYAKAAATRAAMGNPLLTAWSVVGCIIFAIASVLIALFFIQIKFGDEISEQIGAAMPHTSVFFALFGAIVVSQPTSRSRGALKRLRERFVKFRLRFHRKPKVKKEKPPKQGPLETVYIYDELAGRPFTKMVPLYVLSEKLPVTCRYTYEPGITKWLAAGVGAGIGMAILFVALMFSYGQVMGMVFSLLIGSPVGAVFGYFGITPFLLETPFWVVRRMRLRDESGEVLFELIDGDTGNIQNDPCDIFPEEHTHLMGLPVPVARELRLALAHRGAAVAAAPASNGSNGAAARERPSNPQITAAMAYNPTIHRATTLYEELEQRDFKEEFKGGMTGMQKIQVYSLMMMAIASVGLLVFLILITAK